MVELALLASKHGTRHFIDTSLTKLIKKLGLKDGIESPGNIHEKD